MNDVRIRPDGSGMDSARTQRKSRFPSKVIAVVAVACLALFSMPFLLARLPTAAPSADLASVVVSSAQYGQIVVGAMGHGTLQPERVHVITARTSGVVTKVLIQPGATVRPDTTVADISNALVEQDVTNAAAQLRYAQANLESVRALAKQNILDAQSALAVSQAKYRVLLLETEATKGLYNQGFVARLQYETSQIKQEEAKAQQQFDATRVSVNAIAGESQITEAEAKVVDAQSTLTEKQTEADGLQVRAGFAGIVQSIEIDAGQELSAGSDVGRISTQRDLEAVLSVPESEGEGITPGIHAIVTTPVGDLGGMVRRVDPRATNGNLVVHVALTGAARPSIRPDMLITGRLIEGALPASVYIERPAGIENNTTVTLYKISANGKLARRLLVRLGNGSIDKIDVVSGLVPGDRVIISDMSSYNNAPLITLH